MRQFRGVVRGVDGFARNREGNFAVLFGAAASVLALGVGFAVNISQLYNARSSLQGVVDAAVTSTARDLTLGVITETDANKTVQAFLEANSTAGILQANQIVLDRLTVNRTANTVQADAHVDVGLYFPLFSTSTMRRVTASTSALYSDKTVEVAMMLDVTGSMRPDWRTKTNKIGDLQAAASQTVKDLLDQNRDPNDPRIRVSIIPYAEAVNTGGLADTVFVETETGPKVPPPIDAPVAVSTTVSDHCATERKDKDGYADYSSDGPYTQRRDNQGKIYLAKVNRDYRMTLCPTAALVPLTADEDKLLTAIDHFQAGGVTAGGIAAQWGYYMLSPSWRTAISSARLGAGPANFDRNRVAKIAILMTDGQFNTAFAGGRGASRSQDQGQKSRANAEAICDNMKRDSIEIFTIGFDLNDPAMSATERDQAKSLLKNCATDDTSSLKHYYEAANGAELKQAFGEISRNIEKLTISR
ncbi:pilus assembly protein [Mesorhizobium sp. CA18]|uniref:pilus assembly protein n=1 Tax=unclassified Mesorhizobium TaxID=325217 RepID=UPI001CCBC994|nr:MULTISPECIES: pilus assembly protein [unclassified Mesorhizobium]MBZ9736462.1 pilus assembly protein [Mesorhizobium sp. CA9]MBZ9826864.1 pilus assembly protein [Mesorhizobium sp. CA18]MBZ9834932.1 pilus assembly protein [Mesorhizobium sp. CA2]MBZ9838438.1 pilus assembly protein [Mesorhizobium sp. CA3]MBZ9879061.1 pilus assembly protein [Mesorhizobium sp. Ca11]